MSLSLQERFMMLPAADRRAVINHYGKAVFKRLVQSWRWRGRPEQREPPGDWFTWLILTGRGWGKTTTGGETADAWALSGQHEKLMFMGKDITDARQIMYEKGLLEGPYRFKPKREWPTYNREGSLIKWPNGARAKVFGAEDIEQARGWEVSAAWLDEFAAFRHAARIWYEVVIYTVRVQGPRGHNPKVLITTTPKRKKILKEIAEANTTTVTHGSTFDNRSNLAQSFMNEVQRRARTSLGRQEVFGEQLEEVEGAAWTQALLDRQRIDAIPGTPEIEQTVVGVDPAAGAGTTGIVAASRTRGGQMYVTHDRSIQAGSAIWGRTAVELAVEIGASVLVIEVNQGGDMAKQVLARAIEDYNKGKQSQDRAVLRIEMVRASKGKLARAEPVQQLYELGLIWHVEDTTVDTIGPRPFEELEQQQTTFTNAVGDESPDRMDALVWALTFLAPEAGLASLEDRALGAQRLAAEMRRMSNVINPFAGWGMS